MKINKVAVIAAVLLTPLLAFQAQAKKAGKAAPAPVSDTFTVTADQLTNLKVGDKVGVAYHEDAGKMIADTVQAVTADEGGKKKGKNKAAGSHVEGTISAIDTTAKTITVDVPPAHKKKA